jgi:hypothetical protein
MSSNPFELSNDAVEDALQTLRSIGVRSAEKKTSFQIKVGPFNFYPVKGTIMHDSDHKARRERGLEAFINILRKNRLVSSTGPATPAVRLVVPDDNS